MNKQSPDKFKDLVIYQIYTRSFKDSNGDGIGDFNGVIEKLDYLQWLGIDVVWLSPFCDSPNVDNGYDVSDYRNVMGEFGTLEDLDRLIEEAHRRDILVMMDLVMNHSSNQHPWFRQRPEYYYWTDTPNNWDSYFHNSAWTFDKERGQYYLHLFYPEQPDLNWENPELRSEMHDIARFWIERGIDAFRMDAIHHIGKPEGLPDAPENNQEWHFKNFKNTPRTHQYLRELYDKVLAGTRVFTVGETGGTTPKTSRLYVDRSRRELDMIFLFDHIWKMNDDLRNIGRFMKPLYRHLSPEGWNSLFFGNHDFARQLTIFGDEAYRRESATAIATLLLTLWGTPFIYQGEEIGMTNANFPSIDDYDCKAAKRHYFAALERGVDKDLAFKEFSRRTRDNSRTPMQWNSGGGAGFSDARPWLKINANYPQVNVESQRGVPGSILEHYRYLLTLRKHAEVLRRGDLRFISSTRRRPEVLVYRRSIRGGATALIVANPASQYAVLRLPARYRKGYYPVYRNLDTSLLGDSPLGDSKNAGPDSQPEASMSLAPWETRVYFRA